MRAIFNSIVERPAPLHRTASIHARWRARRKPAAFEIRDGNQSMRRATIAALLTATLILGGCNTVRGLGDDLKSVANAVDEET
jgi:predicted small secreted protein